MATVRILLNENTTRANALSQLDNKAQQIANYSEVRRRVEQAVTTMLARQAEMRQHGNALVAKQIIEVNGTTVIIHVGKPRSIIDKLLGR
jgi:hypothetical protein